MIGFIVLLLFWKSSTRIFLPVTLLRVPNKNFPSLSFLVSFILFCILAPQWLSCIHVFISVSLYRRRLFPLVFCLPQRPSISLIFRSYTSSRISEVSFTLQVPIFSFPCSSMLLLLYSVYLHDWMVNLYCCHKHVNK